MNDLLLIELHARIHQVIDTANGKCVLDKELLKSERIPAIWKDVFEIEKFSLIEARLSPLSSESGNFTLSGTTSLFKFQNVKAEIMFFLSIEKKETGSEKNYECIISFPDLPQTWNVCDTYPDMPGYYEYKSAETNEVRESFVRSIGFSNFKFVFCSFDFYSLASEVKWVKFEVSISKEFASVHGKSRPGFNFTAQAEFLKGDFWDEIKTNELFGNASDVFSSPFQVFCSVTRIKKDKFQTALTPAGSQKQEKDGVLSLVIGHERAEQSPFQLGTFTVNLKQFFITTPVELSLEDAGFSFQLGLWIRESFELDLKAHFLPGIPILKIFADFVGDDAFTLDDLKSLLKLEDAVGSLDLGPFGKLFMKRLDITMSLTPVKLLELRVVIATENPWYIAGNAILIEPALVWTKNISYPSEEYSTSFAIEGVAYVGAATANVYASDDGQIRANLAIGSVLDTELLFDDLFPFAPAFEITNFELEGDYLTENYSITLEAESWKFPIDKDASGKEEYLELTDLEITATWEPADKPESNTDDADTDTEPAKERQTESTFKATVAANIDVAGYIASVYFELSKSPEVHLTLPKLNLADLSGFLTFIPHEEFGDFIINELALSLKPDTNEFDFTGTSDQPIDVLPGFKTIVKSFKVKRSREPGKDFEKEAGLTLGFKFREEILEVTGQYTNKPISNESTQTQWKFSASRKDPIPLVPLLESLAGFLELDFPIDLGEMEVRDLFLSFNTGKGERYFSLTGDLYNHEKKISRFMVTAIKPPASESATAPAPQKNQKWKFLCQLGIIAEIDLAKLPIAGPQLESIHLKLGGFVLTIASDGLTKSEIETLKNSLSTEVSLPAIDPLPPYCFTLILTNGQIEYPLHMPLPIKKKEPAINILAMSLSTSDSQTVDHTHWFDINKNLKAIALNRIGVRFQKSRLVIVVDASLTLSAIRIGFAGLGVSSPLRDFDPEFVLDGLNITFEKPPALLSGGFLKNPMGIYLGQARLKLAKFDLSALGAYGKLKDKDTSMFVYASLRTMAGTPAMLKVRGVVAAFGLNTAIRVPTLENIQNFSLITAAMPVKSNFLKPGTDPITVMRSLEQDIKPSSGDRWFAMGLILSTFELGETLVLAIVNVEPEFNVHILGLSRFSIPPEKAGASPSKITFIEASFEAGYEKEEDALKITGAITKRSYLLSPLNQIRGQFACYIWLNGNRAGEFIYTIGGFAPSFKIPDGYPHLKRLQASWHLSNQIDIKGSVYFAFLPHCMMAGGELMATWHKAGIRAWFTVRTDFIMHWKPFFYKSKSHVTIGVSYRVHLIFTSFRVSVHIGTSIDLHGPPFGGKVHINLRVVSFTISFGSSSPSFKRIETWKEFSESFLEKSPGPALALAQRSVSTEPVSLVINDGLVKDFSIQENYTGNLRWNLHPERLAFSVYSRTPLTLVEFNNKSLQTFDKQLVFDGAPGVNPMGIENGKLVSHLSIQFLNQDGTFPLETTMEIHGITENLPASLWTFSGQSLDPNSKMLFAKGLTGIRFVPKILFPATTLPLRLEPLLYEQIGEARSIKFGKQRSISQQEYKVIKDGSNFTFEWQNHKIQNKNLILNSLLDAQAVKNRNEIFAELGKQDFHLSSPSIETFAKRTSLLNWPTLQVVGQ